MQECPVAWGDYRITLLDHREGEGLALRPWRQGERMGLTVGPAAPGDRLVLPETHGGGRSIKRLCMDRRISLPERDRLPGRLRGRMPGGGVAAGRGYGVCSTGGGALPVHSDYRSGKGERFDMKSEMERDILKVLVTEEELKARITEMGAELYEQFHGKNPLFLGVLKGSFVFMADLVRACQVKSDVEFIAVSSYQNATVSSGRVQITHDLQQDITGRHLIIVEDILDSGNTLAFLKDYFMTKGAASITIVTLLDKPSRRTKAITADLAGFVVPDEFVVGYGLDYCQQYRNVPYIGVLKPEVYSGE